MMNLAHYPHNEHRIRAADQTGLLVWSEVPVYRTIQFENPEVYESNLEMIGNISFVRGTAPWILTDFRSPRRPLPRIQDFWNRKGLISEQGIRK